MKRNLRIDEPENVTGRLDRVTYHSPDSGWGILQLTTEPGEPFTAAGIVADPSPGEQMRLFGQWEVHPRYGRQFRFQRYELLRPTSPEALVKYLSSGMIKGVGPVLAGKIVATFGPATLEVLDHHPERLTEVPGIGRAKLETLQAGWQEHEQHRRVLLALYEFGLGAALSRRVMERYGPRAAEVVEHQPYRLALEISGIGFVIADRLARRAGLALDDPQRLQAALLHCLNRAASDGHFYLPQGVLLAQAAGLTDIAEEPLAEALAALADQGRIVYDPVEGAEAPVYATQMLAQENEVAQHLAALLDSEPHLMPTDAELLRWLEAQETLSGLELTAEQRAAVLAALREPLSVITGGPGTGKTTVVRFLAHLARQSGKRLALAAPTGRAAQRLEQVTGHAASTLHRLLSYDPFRGQFRHGPGNPLELDWLIVDEASMLEVALANSVLRALPPGASLLLVGDADQLPSVGPGQFLGDLVRSDRVPVVRLEQIHRQAAGSLIVQSAHAINRGEPPNFPSPQTWRTSEDCVFLERPDPHEAADKVVQMVTEGLVRMGFEHDQIQVITSLHRGPIGVQELNRRLQAALNPPGAGHPEVKRGEMVFRQGDRVLQTVNNYDKAVYNGDIGKLTAVDPITGGVHVTFEQGTVAYQRSELDQIELAYALTIHKSQGSEFPAVVMVLHSSHYIMLYRNLLYTGVTRARRMLCLVGDHKGLYKALHSTHPAERYTGLTERLRRAALPLD
ncbi:MAG TPA: ATP-dependent RecD-like DNA helicase [Armatimonadota bacterium]|jgi:exodeoxyribonuclease V alpha subunit